MKEIVVGILNNITHIIEYYGYLAIIIGMIIESSFIPFPSELIMIPAGYIAYKGSLKLTLVILSGTLGSIIGAFINYFIARFLGAKFINKFGKFLFISKNSLLKVDKFFYKHGAISTLIGRLIPVVRQYISFPAGLTKMNIKKFVFYSFLGSIIWMFSLSMFGFVFGANKELINANFNSLMLIIFLVIIKILLLYILILRFRRANYF